MKNQKIIFIVLGAVAAAGLGIFIYSRNQQKKKNGNGVGNGETPNINLNDKNAIVDYLWKHQPKTGGVPTMPRTWFEKFSLEELWTMIYKRYPNIILPNM